MHEHLQSRGLVRTGRGWGLSPLCSAPSGLSPARLSPARLGSAFLPCTASTDCCCRPQPQPQHKHPPRHGSAPGTQRRMEQSCTRPAAPCPSPTEPGRAAPLGAQHPTTEHPTTEHRTTERGLCDYTRCCGAARHREGANGLLMALGMTAKGGTWKRSCVFSHYSGNLLWQRELSLGERRVYRKQLATTKTRLAWHTSYRQENILHFRIQHPLCQFKVCLLLL